MFVSGQKKHSQQTGSEGIPLVFVGWTMEQAVLRDERTDYEWDRPSLIVIFLMGSSQIPLEASVSFSVTGVP